ncbi:hypothetical protein OG453_22605 [Streptomyces sp. NBC_01381]|uniref:hypothetical protein n=1 Tax=Streptomyces sp. NBC_01381 TaxID=2903845 RepID=UPI002254DFBB|nr:hypothetical protein [Streptomyces sp. NBC_01381]MCX4669435.1 hypothetical protein [Streptomyces sp. NBC_01381]
MNPKRNRRPLASLTALTVASLLTLAGCSGSSDGGEDSKGKKEGGKEATASANPEPEPADANAPATAAQLKKTLVTKAEAKGYSAQDNAAANVTPKSDKPQCRAIADATASGTDRTPEPAAWASRSYGSTASPGLAVTTSLFSYEGEGAQKTLADLRKAVAACAGGFSTSGNNGGATVAYTSVKSEQVAAGGDESVSWEMTGAAQGSEVPMHLTAVRVENTVTLFFTLHLTDPQQAKLPADLLSTQMAKVKTTLAK